MRLPLTPILVVILLGSAQLAMADTYPQLICTQYRDRSKLPADVAAP